MDYVGHERKPEDADRDEGGEVEEFCAEGDCVDVGHWCRGVAGERGDGEGLVVAVGYLCEHVYCDCAEALDCC